MSMNYFTEFDVVDNKLVELLEANQLIRKFNAEAYPITLTITPDVAPDAQMTMYSIEDGASSRDAKLVLSFPVGDIGMKVSGRLVMSDSLMNKIKGFAKKMHYLYLQANFAMQNECPAFVRAPRSEAEPIETVSKADFAEFYDEEATE